ncbi:hypothetical protein JCM3765_001204 [Sporobolomyces pararoseus]
MSVKDSDSWTKLDDEKEVGKVGTTTLRKLTKRKSSSSRQPDLLAKLPIELLHLIVSNLNLSSLLNVSLLSKPLRAFILSKDCETVWKRAIREMEIPELEAKLKPVELATLVLGRSCRICGKNTTRKPDFFLRCRLCTTCWDEQIVYEGPDEPDPAFEEYFAGTKRYTPRSRSGKRWKKMKTFFLLPSLEATSSFLSDLLEPQVEAFEAAIETDPLAELDDFMMFKNLPEATRSTLDQRQDWAKRVWRDGEKLTKWHEAMSKAEREEKKLARATAK